MKKSKSDRTEYQEFLYSLFVKYGIDYIGESWSTPEWKAIVRRLSNDAQENFNRELSEFNIKNPSDEIWSDEELEEFKADEEEKRIADAKIEEERRIADAKIEEERRIADAKIEEEERRIADAKREDEIETEEVESKSLFKQCPYCAEDINIAAIKCKHCGEKMKNMKKYHKDYEVSEALSFIVAFVGYAVIVIGIIFPIATDMFGYRTPEMVVFSYFALVIILGVCLIVTGQMIRAIVDNTNANREILWILKAKLKDEGWEEELVVEVEKKDEL